MTFTAFTGDALRQDMRWLGTFSGIIIAVITSGRPLVYGNQQIDVTNLGGGEAAVPVPVVIAMPLLGALV